ncbi:hypothetical protein F3Y22_tig00112471pilonHSYRG00011 [Hibiscus syriacus]|uniref:CSC1/OSCA1-like 7TM region domain-containing protein n=1 Tax=Hibiscus syriacus TaxID=106335 RepID=A0A6A2Y9J9_HIBSY|nr:hypothetical protein F3Y22_tig00112471pilonHSYRG00011 [Hibiscus syriacus]
MTIRNSLNLMQEAAERERVSHDPHSIVPAAFVSFKSRWGQRSVLKLSKTVILQFGWQNGLLSLRDVYWDNFAIPYFELTIRRESVKSVIQGFLPGIALKIFLASLPKILMTMSIIEGYPSLSSLDRRSAAKYHMFILINIFLGSVITGCSLKHSSRSLQQNMLGFPISLLSDREQGGLSRAAAAVRLVSSRVGSWSWSWSWIPETIGEFIPLKANFFITYIMVDGWAGIAAESLRLVVPLILFHLKNACLVKTEQDRAEAMDPGCIDSFPVIDLAGTFDYNTDDYKSNNIPTSALLLGLLTTKKIGKSYYAVLPLPVLTIWFYAFRNGRFELAFVKFPLQEAMIKDTLERATEPNFNLKAYLKDAYKHPVFKGTDMERPL